MKLREISCWERYYGALKRLLNKDIDIFLDDGKIVVVQKISRSIIVLGDRTENDIKRAEDLKIVKCVEKMIEKLPSPSKDIIFYHYIDHSFHRSDDEFSKHFSSLSLSSIARRIGYNPASMRKLWIKAIGEAIETMKGIPECKSCIESY